MFHEIEDPVTDQPSTSAVDQKENEVKGKVKNINLLDIKSNIKKTDKDW